MTKAQKRTILEFIDAASPKRATERQLAGALGLDLKAARGVIARAVQSGVLGFDRIHGGYNKRRGRQPKKAVA